MAPAGKNGGLESKWYSANELSSLVKLAQPGDRLEFNRGRYSHFAIYAGERQYESLGTKKTGPCVIHASSPPGANSKNVVFCSHSSNKRQHGLGAVTMDPLKDVVLEDTVRINNSADNEWDPYSSDKILQRAEKEMKENTETYNATANNCEHFVNWCRYGQRKSHQADKARGYIFGGVFAAIVGVVAFIFRLFRTGG